MPSFEWERKAVAVSVVSVSSADAVAAVAAVVEFAVVAEVDSR